MNIPQNYVYVNLSAEQVRQIKGIEGNGVGSGLLPQLIDMALTQLQASQAANVAALASWSNLSGVDGTGSNAAPLAGVNTTFSGLYTKINAILSSLKSAGIMASS